MHPWKLRMTLWTCRPAGNGRVRLSRESRRILHKTAEKSTETSLTAQMETSTPVDGSPGRLDENRYALLYFAFTSGIPAAISYACMARILDSS